MVPRDGINGAAQAADTGIFNLAGKFESYLISATWDDCPLSNVT
jgi:hypothetical protein